MTCSNESLRFVSYPTAVLAKSSKMIPTMLLGWMVERRYYRLVEWMAALCITAGVLMFHLSRLEQHNDNMEQKQASSSLYGMGLLALSLFMDGLLGACQGLLKKSNTIHHDPPTAMETMLYVNLYAAMLWLPYSMAVGQFVHGCQLLQQGEMAALWHGMLGLNATAAMGQCFIFITITRYSSLTCTMITTTRKFFTILLSVLHFGHVFTATQWACVAMVFAGLYLSLISKQQTGRSSIEHGAAGAEEEGATRTKMD